MNDKDKFHAGDKVQIKNKNLFKNLDIVTIKSKLYDDVYNVKFLDGESMNIKEKDLMLAEARRVLI